MESKDSIDMWINTCGTVRKTVRLAAKHNDIETVIELLNKFKEATAQLETMMRIINEQKFTA
tara:strand:- start:418 stop:603 length:186 start_codon:yes stop_codon:yes gene_type:complete